MKQNFLNKTSWNLGGYWRHDPDLGGLGSEACWDAGQMAKLQIKENRPG